MKPKLKYVLFQADFNYHRQHPERIYAVLDAYSYLKVLSKFGKGTKIKPVVIKPIVIGIRKEAKSHDRCNN